jgi:hypothetical protein
VKNIIKDVDDNNNARYSKQDINQSSCESEEKSEQP